VSVGEPEEVRLRDGSTALIRQIGPADAPLVRAIYGELSDVSRRRRFLAPTDELSDEDVMYLTDVDHRRHEALIAIDPERDRAVGVARYVRAPGDRETGEVAVVVVDDWHRRGLGTALLDRLTERARENGLRRYTAVVSPDNDIVLGAMERNGAERTGTTAEGEVEFAFELPPDGIGDRLAGALRAAGSTHWEFLGQVLRLLPWTGRSRSK
jgi:RimJ/RimL family protein N-acetyltransferase